MLTGYKVRNHSQAVRVGKGKIFTLLKDIFKGQIFCFYSNWTKIK